MSSKFIFSLCLGLIAVHSVTSDCTDFKYGKCDNFEGAFETLSPAGGLPNCQDVFCAIAYKDNCTTFIYNRLDDTCAIYDGEAATPKCDIHSAVPQDNPADCENPTDKCQTFTEFECRYDGNILEDFSLPTEDQCKTVCSIVPKCTYYVYDEENGGCECRDSKATQECDLIRGPQKPSYTNDCGNPHPASTSTEPPTVPPETRQVFVRVIDASKNTLIPSVDYTYTVNQGNDQTDSAATGEFTLTVPLNSNVELTVMKAGFYDNVQSDLIDEDKNWLIVMIPSDGKDRIVLSWTAEKPKDLDLQLAIGDDCRITTNQRECSGASLDTDWKNGGTDAGEGGVETISIEQYQGENTKYLAYVLNNANDEHPMSGSNAQVTLYYGAQSKMINAPKSGDQTDSNGNGYWIVGCFTGSSKLDMLDEKNLYSDNYNYEC